MPSVSKKQHNFMAAVANNPAFAKKAGVPASVGSDFIKADKGRTFGKGGKIMAKSMPMFGGKESYSEELKEAKAIKSGKITPQQYAKAEGKEKAKPKQTSFAEGGMPMPPSMADRPDTGGAPPIDPKVIAALMAARRGAGAGREMPPGVPSARPPMGPQTPAFKKGGFIKSADGVASKGKTKAQQFSSGGSVSSRADGVAAKGKTRGKMC